MFTGIIQHLGTVLAVEDVAFGKRLRVDIASWRDRAAAGTAIGASVAVNGCCLTVAEIDSAGAWLRFDVIAQTLVVTTLGRLKAGDRVNLEHAVTPSTMLGGHIVQGHVDGVGRVAGVTSTDAEHRIRIQPHANAAMGLIVERGAIAVSGVSLTVATVGPDWFEVALIPTTLALTNLGSLCEGDAVNLEYDYIAKIVANWLDRRGEA